MRFSLADLTWDGLDGAVRARTKLLVRDVVACAAAGTSLGAYPELAARQPASDSRSGSASVWFHDRQAPPSYAALVNGALAHHADMDDGHAGASVHAGVSVVPASVAVAESSRASAEDCLGAIVAGYMVAIAFGRAMREALEKERAHPPAVVGGFGAAAAAARLLGLDDDGIAGAVALAGTLSPLAPFESFTRGASVKDLYAGWPALIGVEAAFMARDGIVGPRDHFAVDTVALDPRDIEDVYLKRFATCRSTQAALSALQTLLPVEASRIRSVRVETYRFAYELSRDSDASTPIGAKASIPASIACLIVEGRVDPDAFTTEALAARQWLAERVAVTDTLASGARVVLVLDDGSERTARAETAADEDDPDGKFHRLMQGKTLDVELLRTLVA